MEFPVILFVIFISCTTLQESSAYIGRRFDFSLDINDVGAVVGVPSMPSHLPEAEAILPGHTLIRPTLGMLKSAIKFPHRELDDGAGVNGNINSLGLKWDGRNERVLYSGFRRLSSLDNNELDEDILKNFRRKALDSNEKPPWFRRSGDSRGYQLSDSNYVPTEYAFGDYVPTRRNLADYIMVVPVVKKSSSRPSFTVTNLVLDLDDHPKEAEEVISERLQFMPKSKKSENSNRLLLYLANPRKSPLYLTDLFKRDNNVFSL